MATNYEKKYNESGPISNTLNPTMTGSTVMAIAFEGGVAVASDRSVFYGKMERIRNSTRQYRVNPYCLVVFSGDFADFQWLQNLIERKQLDLQRGDRKQYLKPKMVHSFLTALFYQRRSKMNPLWNTIVVCGMQPVQFQADKFEPYIGVVNLYGVAYTTKYVATDFGAFILNQLLETRLKSTPNALLSKEEALKTLETAMTVSVYRSCKAGKSYDVALINSDGINFEEVKEIPGDWEIADKYGHGKF